MTTTQTLTRPASMSEYRERLQQTRAPIVTESIQRGLAYQPQPNDLFITPADKFSATWLQQIVHSLRTQGDMDFDDISQVIPWLEMAHRLGLNIHAPQGGGFQAFKSHLSWQNIPKGGRYIVAFRDPKDVLVSMYHFLNGWHWQAGAVSITEFASHSMRLDGWSYWDHLVSWWEQRHNRQVLLLTYEGMKTDLPATVQTIAHFLRIELDQDLLNLLCEQASLEFMLAHKSKFSERLQQAAAAKDNLWPPSGTTSNIRNGLVVGHGAKLPSEIGAEIDALWRETVEPRTGLASYDALLAALA